VARSVDTQQPHLVETLKRAHANKGASFVEIYQNCLVFNDRTFARFTDKAVAADNQLLVEHGQPLVFGKDRQKGLVMRSGCLEIEVVTLGRDGVTADDLLVHDETNRNLATLLASLDTPQYPVALGVLYCDPADSYAQQIHAQIRAASEAVPNPSLNSLLRRGQTWSIDR
jgi:2-oxoglutarate ferredoxin oxidoreductase subunit beta